MFRTLYAKLLLVLVGFSVVMGTMFVLVIRNSDIQGMNYGIMVPSKVGDTTDTGQTPITYTIQDSYLRNYYNIYAETMNAVTGVATAALDSVPLVTISGDVPSYMYGRHPHQEVNLHADADQTAIFIRNWSEASPHAILSLIFIVDDAPRRRQAPARPVPAR